MYKVCIFILSSKQSTKAAQNSQYLGGKENFANLPDPSCQSFTKICPNLIQRKFLRDKGNTITLNL